jgi:hypothetical protein
MPDDDEESAPDAEEVAETEFLEAEAGSVTLSDAEREALERDRRSGSVPDEVS